MIEDKFEVHLKKTHHVEETLGHFCSSGCETQHAGDVIHASLKVLPIEQPKPPKLG